MFLIAIIEAEARGLEIKNKETRLLNLNLKAGLVLSKCISETCFHQQLLGDTVYPPIDTSSEIRNLTENVSYPVYLVCHNLSNQTLEQTDAATLKWDLKRNKNTVE